ncbi:MAG: response regulator [Nitrospinota bacterium]
MVGMAPNRDPWSERKVLVVDDDEVFHEILELALENTGQIISALDGDEIVEKAKSLRPDFIIMDLQMSAVHGFEAIQLLKADPVTQNIPVIVVSAYVREEDRKHAFESGADAFIPKPLLLPSLREELRKILG